MERPSLKTSAAFVAFLGGYVALILWFKWVDVYYLHFATSGPLILVYNALRAVFAFYLFWIVQAPGTLLLRLVAGSAYENIHWLDRLALGFLAGTGIWHVALLVLGLAGFYTVMVAISLTVPAVALAFWDARDCFERLSAAVSSPALADSLASLGRWRTACLVGAVLLVLAVWSDLLLVKGLYPGGGHDYYTHYFSYYKAVVNSGNLGPNEVWYHFYYSKGAGLFFLSMLLTDPLAPQLVTFCFISVAALVLFRLLSGVAPSSLWPWVGALLFLGLYIYTPGPPQNRAHGGWGDFEKLHELNAALVIGVIWLTVGMLQARGSLRLAWVTATASAVTAAIVINITISVFLGAVLVAVAAWQFLTRRWCPAVIAIGLAAVAGIVLVSDLLINYLATGLADDQALLFFWPFADVEKLHRWNALPLVIQMHLGRTGQVAKALPLTTAFVMTLADWLRLDLLFALVLGGALVSLVAMVRRRTGLVPAAPIGVLLIVIVVYGVLSVFAGRSEPISFYRYSSFMLPVMITVGVLMWQIPARSNGRFMRLLRDGIAPVAIMGACAVASLLFVYSVRPLWAVQLNAWRFATGAYSIDTAYTNENGWPGRLPWGGIHPGARGAYSVVGPGTPIQSLHVHSYCMLPGCRMEHRMSTAITPDWDRLMFGTPEEGRAVLQAAGRNYFLFSRSLARDLGMESSLPVSPLFSPDTIARYLGIRWTDGDTALLTWLGPDTTPLDDAWIADYRRAVENSLTVQRFPVAAMKHIYEKLRATPHPWKTFELPWSKDRR